MNKFQFDSVVGNFTTIQFLKRDIMTNASGRLLLFHGDVGTGKSSTALIYALAYCCENPGENGPCLQCEACKRNLLALSRKQNSSMLSVINMGLYRKSTDVVDLINKIFVLQTPGRAVYVLEEFHLLPGDVQANFLREMDNMQDNLKIILTTSSLHQINEAIRSRANKFVFSKLTKIDARRLVRLAYPTVAYSEEAMDILFEISDYTPRDILVNLQFLIKTGATEDEVKSYLQFVSADEILELFTALEHGNVAVQRAILNDFRSKLSVQSIEVSLRKFVLNAVYCISGCKDVPFTSAQVGSIRELFDRDYLLFILNELDKTRFTHPYALDDLFFRLMFKRNKTALAGVVCNVKKDASAKSIATQRLETVLTQSPENTFSKLTKESLKGGV